MTTYAPRAAARWSLELLLHGRVMPQPAARPSALLGAYVAAYLALPNIELSHAAVSGVLASRTFLEENSGIRDESYALLQEFGVVLSVDVQDLLNRSVDRSGTLAAYRESLIETARRSQEHLVLLEARQDEADTAVREVRRRASDIQRLLNEALREKDYATAGARQSALSDVQGEQAVATATQREVREVVRLFETSLDFAAEKLQAIDANREALIAGVSVVDIPGADELGVLRSGGRRSTADPEDVFGPVEPTQ